MESKLLCGGDDLQGRAGQGRAGQDRAGQGIAGQSVACIGADCRVSVDIC